MKLKSLVIAYQNDAVNTFSDLVHTARQGMGVALARSPAICRPTVRVATGLKS